MVIIGEKIDCTRKQASQAIRNRDADFLRDLAMRQYEKGASYPHINAAATTKRQSGRHGMAGENRSASGPGRYPVP